MEMRDRAVHFPISDQMLLGFRRSVPKAKDCVINALELCGVIDASAADVLRILVGDVGVNFHQIGEIFTATSGVCHVFKTYPVNLPECRSDVEAIVEGLKKSSMLFAGFTVQEVSHIVVVARTLNGGFVYIDPQNPQAISGIRDLFQQAQLVHILVRGDLSRCPEATCMPLVSSGASSLVRGYLTDLARGQRPRSAPSMQEQDLIRRDWLLRLARAKELKLPDAAHRRARSRSRASMSP